MSTGRWKPIERAWHQERYVHCEVCGRLIPSRRWSFQDGPRDVTACEPSCEELYVSYLKHAHGGATP